MAKRGRGYNEKSLQNLKQNRQAMRDKLKEDVSKIEEIELNEEELEIIIPTKALFKPEEQKRFMAFLKMYIKQFGKQSELEVSDLVAIATLCKNHILEDRILSDAENAAEAIHPIEKLKKENAKLTEQLAATRVQRVDPRAGQDFTVMDLIAEYQTQRREDIDEKIKRYKEEEKDFEDLIKDSPEDMIH